MKTIRTSSGRPTGQAAQTASRCSSVLSDSIPCVHQGRALTARARAARLDRCLTRTRRGTRLLAGSHLGPPRRHVTWRRGSARASCAAASLAADAQFPSRVTLVEVYATVTDAGGRPSRSWPATPSACCDGGEPSRRRRVRRERLSAVGGPRHRPQLEHGRAPAGAGARRGGQFLGNCVPGRGDADRHLERGGDAGAAVARPRGAAGGRRRPDAVGQRPGCTMRCWTRMARIEVTRRAAARWSCSPTARTAAAARRPAQVADRARRTPVLIYPVSIGRRNSPLLAQLAAFTGGRAFWLRGNRTDSATPSAPSRRNSASSTSLATVRRRRVSSSAAGVGLATHHGRDPGAASQGARRDRATTPGPPSRAPRSGSSRAALDAPQTARDDAWRQADWGTHP